MALMHGGQLQQVAEHYKIPMADWLDLSTGIAPTCYSIPNIPLNVWQQLPQQNPTLIAAAKQYYQCSQLVITNGSQAIIKALPGVYRQKNASSEDVYLPERGYKEHAHAWKMAGYNLHFYRNALPEITALSAGCVVVIINPNNPTGQYFNVNIIKQYHQQLKQLNGLLVLDEAFVDVMPAEQSYCQQVNDSHCLVLRSFGKFFGLAGIRIGFLVANNAWCKTFEALLGPWQVNGPAQTVAEQALCDTHWQEKQKQTLKQLSTAQENKLLQVFPNTLILAIKGCDLFLTVEFRQSDSAKKLYHLLCQQGVYCRLADEQDTLRFGITTADTLERLAIACAKACKQLS
ncbi:threonine-phosphate decarboxylase CobD [Cognaticolwellia beringensis]|uniref:threonine-phosphate decarboxylase n=1 Tax=Cognaticolwellia beringensis TaxID=1967665 RepID=A0A222GA81_9GAMM|nr:threonine-phosphate decarboxylase CobD [Cognaticolwellia beringensis]ASP48789.1 threonine-phosphate decarboxylase [Cognaticolwellia beringensis]